MKAPRCTLCGGKGHNRITCRQLPTEGRKYCSSCEKWKEIPHDFHRNNGRADGWQYHCKKCFKEKHYNYSPQKRRETHIAKFYNISWDSYVGMHTAQNGKCSICDTDINLLVSDRLTTAHVDHDHTTGEIRGLLCHYCNSGLGYFKDREDLLLKAISYLSTRVKKVA